MSNNNYRGVFYFKQKVKWYKKLFYFLFNRKKYKETKKWHLLGKGEEIK